MILIGEKINATRRTVARAIQTRDSETIRELATSQAKAGATYLDINGGDPTKEVDNLLWLQEVVQEASDRPLSLDSANPQALEACMAHVRHKPIVNSITLETKRKETMLPLVRDQDCSVIAVLVGDHGVPHGVEDRMALADELVGLLLNSGKKQDEIFVDPCFLTVYTEEGAGLTVLESIRCIRARWPHIHISGGVSNASYGLPVRKWINQAYLLLAMAAGLDAAIVDPCSVGTPQLVSAAEVILNRDEMGMNYIVSMREEQKENTPSIERNNS
jgi:5-methyltetrahydrofolate--homocysteine methyltransferase